MNSKSVLGKIMTLLSMENDVEMTYAKLKDGTIVESPTFDVGEPLEIVSEDGTKTPAPDGEHELSLRDESGNENLIKVIVKDGKIAERENVELEEKPKEEVVDKDTAETADTGDVKMADAEMVPAHPLPNTTDEDPRNLIETDDEAKENDPLITLSYRIDELEKAMKMMIEKMGEESPVDEEAIDEETPAAEGGVAMAEVEDEELPKLDGAPLEISKLSAQTLTPNYGKKIENSQSSFLSKLYR